MMAAVSRGSNPLQKSSIHNVAAQQIYNPFDHQRLADNLQRRKTEITVEQYDKQGQQPAAAVLALGQQQRSSVTREQSASEITAMDILQLQTAGGSDMAENVSATNPSYLGADNGSISMHSKRQSMKSHLRGRNSMISNKESGQDVQNSQKRLKTLVAAH